MSTRARPLPETLAQRGARCPLCPERIRPEVDYVAKVPVVGWAHAVCAAGYEQVLADHDEGGEER
jgi:hypothetical protein